MYHRPVTALRRMSLHPPWASGVRWWRVTVLFLLGVDALLLAVHAGHLVLRRWGAEQNMVTDLLLNTIWNGQNDRSVVEIWGYLQLATAALLLIYLSYRLAKSYAYAVWAFIFLIMTADDLLGWHERVGALFADSRSQAPVLGVPAYAFGQIFFWAFLAILLGVLLLLTLRQSDSSTRRGSAQLFVGTVALAVFAVGVDLISALVMETMGRTAYALSVYIETIGELVFVSVILIVVLRLVSDRGTYDVVHKPGDAQNPNNFVSIELSSRSRHEHRRSPRR